MKVKHPYRRTSPSRKIIRAITRDELSEYIADNQTRGWQPISEVNIRRGVYEVLVELQNDYKPS